MFQTPYPQSSSRLHVGGFDIVGETEGLVVGENVGDMDGFLLVDGIHVGLAVGTCVIVGE